MNVVIAGGGTAGHVLPGLALAEEVVRRGGSARFIGTDDGQESRLVPEAGFGFDAVVAPPLRRSLAPANLRVPFALLAGVRDCRPLVRGADVVVGMGGFVSLPAGLAAGREHRALVIHEQNAVLGLANRILARRAVAVAASFDGTDARRARVVVTGNPVRSAIAEVSHRRRELRREAAGSLGIDADRPTVIAFGGSLGASRINRAVVGSARALVERHGAQIVLIAGRAHASALAEEAVRDGIPMRVLDFVERMDLVYAAADVVVCRSGATTCAEVAVAGVPAILVPYPHATADHQRANAGALAGSGAAIVVDDSLLTPDRLSSEVSGLLVDRARREAMARAAASVGRPDAAARLADLLESVT